VLAGFEQFAGIEVSRFDFGTSGHRTKPAGLVIESYRHRRAYTRPEDVEQVKSIVDPTRAKRAYDVHGFFYRDGYAVHEDGERAEGERPGMKRFPEASLLRINHYMTKSVEEYMAKREQWEGAGIPRRGPDTRLVKALDAEPDDTIAMYVPALREALA
jgi:hypothetical protein